MKGEFGYDPDLIGLWPVRDDSGRFVRYVRMRWIDDVEQDRRHAPERHVHMTGPFLKLRMIYAARSLCRERRRMARAEAKLGIDWNQ